MVFALKSPALGLNRGGCFPNHRQRGTSMPGKGRKVQKGHVDSAFSSVSVAIPLLETAATCVEGERCSRWE